jgi:hypothetical protein
MTVTVLYFTVRMAWQPNRCGPTAKSIKSLSPVNCILQFNNVMDLGTPKLLSGGRGGGRSLRPGLWGVALCDAAIYRAIFPFF